MVSRTDHNFIDFVRMPEKCSDRNAGFNVQKSGRIPISAEDVLPVDDPGLKQDEPIEVSSNDPDAEPDFLRS